MRRKRRYRYKKSSEEELRLTTAKLSLAANLVGLVAGIVSALLTLLARLLDQR